MEKQTDIETQRQFDRICDEFEDNWTVHSYKQINTHSQRLGELHAASIAQILVQLDIELRQHRGIEVQPNIYDSFAVYAHNNLVAKSDTNDATLDGEANLDKNASPRPSNENSTPQYVPPVEQLNIGPYRLLQQIGEGGMGVVWLAEQKEPVRRRVAIKLVRQAFGSKEVIGRFEAERQALALMDHQNIAKILDAGTASGGSPYFVMELVRGLPINEYCDKNQLSIRERLQLFVPVCDAVQHAHRKGIIHRDLKPGNILIATKDDVPIPKVIDFGLAKAVEHTTKLTDRTVFTEFGKVVGTLQYMSPEQAELNALDIDTRSDVYSLGAILYELIVGSTPLEKHAISNQSLVKILKVIRENEPPRPSIRFATTNQKTEEICRQRSTDESRLKRMLRSDVEWVIMKAIDKDRSHRYESAGLLGDDIKNYLQQEPLTARPPSFSYRLKKYISKNRNRLALTTVITVLVALTIALTAYGFISNYLDKARQAEEDSIKRALEQQVAQKTKELKLEKDRAVEAEELAKKEKDKAVEAEKLATREKNLSERVRHFLLFDLLSQVDIFHLANYGGTGLKNDIKLSEALENASEQYSPDNIEQKLPGEPSVQAEILMTIARLFSAIDNHEKALSYSNASISILKKTEAEPLAPKLLQAKINRFFLLLKAQKHIDAIAAFTDVFADFDKMLDLNKNQFNKEISDEELKQKIDVRVKTVFDTILEWGNPKNGILPTFNFKQKPSAIEYVQMLANFGKAVVHMQSVEKKIIDRYGLDHPWTGYTLTATASIHFGVADIRKKLGKRLDSAASIFSGGFGEIDTAIAKYNTAREILKQNLEPNNTLNAGVNMLLGVAYKRRQKPGDMELSSNCFQKCHDILQANLRSEHPALINAKDVYAKSLIDLNKYEDAIPHFRELVKERTRLLGEQNFETDDSVYYLALALANTEYVDATERQKAYQEADQLFEKTLKYNIDKNTILDADTRTVAIEYAFALIRFGNWNKAAEKFQLIWEQEKTKEEKDLYVLSWIGYCYHKAQSFEKADEYLRELCTLRFQQFNSYEHPMVIADHYRLAFALQALNQTEELATVLKKIDRKETANASFKSAGTLRLDAPMVNHLQAIGWIVTDFETKVETDRIQIDRTYQFDENTQYQLPKQIIPSELDSHLKEYQQLGYKLIKQQKYSLESQDYIDTLWHRPKAAE